MTAAPDKRPDTAELKRAADLATLMVVDHVRPDRLSDYEDWLSGIHGDIQKQPGLVSVDVIRHLDQPNPEYVILVKFDGRENLDRWRSSPTLSHWLSKVEALVEKEAHFQEAIGLEIWFDRTGRPRQEMPAFWKRVVLSVACVYPMILFLDWVLGPLIGAWPPAARILAVVILLSTVLTWPIMPYASRLLKPWLYPTS